MKPVHGIENPGRITSLQQGTAAGRRCVQSVAGGAETLRKGEPDALTVSFNEVSGTAND